MHPHIHTQKDEDKAPGDLGFGNQFKPEDPEEYEALQLKELKVRPSVILSGWLGVGWSVCVDGSPGLTGAFI